MKSVKKYGRRSFFSYPERKWPEKLLLRAPQWCSVDLRDGNQALPSPLDIDKKLKFFDMLCSVGMRQIEIGFPSASETEYQFVRALAAENRIPSSVIPQVLSPCRTNLLARTVESVRDYNACIMHIYCSTSPASRRIVFNMSEDEIVSMAVGGVQDVLRYMQDSDCNFSLEFSPEHFNQTEAQFALRVCEEVADKWLAAGKGNLIFNLPATVECSSPNVFADQVEWFADHLSCREQAYISVHTHNDRGCAVAAGELALLAGADRVEGTLFGNGERTGNMDIICVAGNMVSQGIDPGLDLSHIPELREHYEQLTGMRVGKRTPYAGELVFTAFSGSHQDAISKGKRKALGTGNWDVPYLLVDPDDFGRQYEPIVRINSQSGKGGLDFVMRNDFGLELPKDMLEDFSVCIQSLSENIGEVLPEKLFASFQKKYILNQRKLMLSAYEAETGEYRLLLDGRSAVLSCEVNCPAEERCRRLSAIFGCEAELVYCVEQNLNGPCGRSTWYACVRTPEGKCGFGAAIGAEAAESSMSAMISAFNSLIM